MIVIFVEFVNQLIDYPINHASLKGVWILRMNTVSQIYQISPKFPMNFESEQGSTERSQTLWIHSLAVHVILTQPEKYQTSKT